MTADPLAGGVRRRGRRRAFAGAAGASLVGLSTAGAMAAAFDVLVRVRPRVPGPRATLITASSSPEDPDELLITLRGPSADEAGHVGVFGARGRLLAGPPERVAEGWRRRARALPGVRAPMLDTAQPLTVTADPWAGCDDPFAMDARTEPMETELGTLQVTTVEPVTTPGPEGARRAVVYLHGRNGHRQTGWWLAPVVVDAGWWAVLPSYRNDEDGPVTGRYLLGGEWIDLTHVLDRLAGQGIEEVVLVGWSMGGNIAASYLRQRERNPAAFAHHPRPVGLVLDAPALDWGSVLRHAARLRRVPGSMVSAIMAYGQLASRIDWRGLNHLEEATHLDLPILVYHGGNDEIVPPELSEQLSAILPHVQLELFEHAGHCRSVNIDPPRYLGLLREFLDRI